MDNDQAKSSPRPKPAIAIEGIVSPKSNDVVLGRGTLINAGNQQYLHLVQQAKRDYVMSPKKHKGKFAHNIVNIIKRLNPPGRFLKQDPESKLWYEISYMKAIQRTRQSLRDGAPKLKTQIEKIEKEKSPDNTLEKRVLNDNNNVYRDREVVYYSNLRQEKARRRLYLSLLVLEHHSQVMEARARISYILHVHARNNTTNNATKHCYSSSSYY
jgi:hypothetical protein